MSASRNARLDRLQGATRAALRIVDAAWMERIGLVAALLALLVLSLVRLGHLSFWNDEVDSIRLATGSLPNLVTRLHPYELVLRGWLRLGESEAWVRGLSILFGLAAVVPVFLIGRRLGGTWAGVVAGLLFATNSDVVGWSQQVAAATAVMLVAAGTTYALLRAVDRPSTRGWLAYTVAAVVALLVDPAMAFLLAAQIAWVVATRRLPDEPRVRLLLAGPILVALIAVAVALRAHAVRGGSSASITILGVNGSLLALLGGTVFVATLTVVLAFVAVDRLRRDDRVWLLVASALAPVGLAIAASVVTGTWNPRGLVLVVPAVSCLAALGLVSIRPGWARAALGVLLAIAVVTSLPVAYRRDTADWRAAIAWMQASSHRTDRIVVIGDASAAPAYYLASLSKVPKRITTAVALRKSGPRQLWVATRSVSEPERLVLYGRLSDRYHRIATSRFAGGLVVALFVPNRHSQSASP